MVGWDDKLWWGEITRFFLQEEMADEALLKKITEKLAQSSVKTDAKLSAEMNVALTKSIQVRIISPVK